MTILLGWMGFLSEWKRVAFWWYIFLLLCLGLGGDLRWCSAFIKSGACVFIQKDVDYRSRTTPQTFWISREHHGPTTSHSSGMMASRIGPGVIGEATWHWTTLLPTGQLPATIGFTILPFTRVQRSLRLVIHQANKTRFPKEKRLSCAYIG